MLQAKRTFKYRSVVPQALYHSPLRLCATRITIPRSILSHNISILNLGAQGLNIMSTSMTHNIRNGVFFSTYNANSSVQSWYIAHLPPCVRDELGCARKNSPTHHCESDLQLDGRHPNARMDGSAVLLRIYASRVAWYRCRACFDTLAENSSTK